MLVADLYAMRKEIGGVPWLQWRKYIESLGRNRVGERAHPEFSWFYTAELALGRSPESWTLGKRHVAERAPAVHLGITPGTTEDEIGNRAISQIEKLHTDLVRADRKVGHWVPAFSKRNKIER